MVTSATLRRAMTGLNDRAVRELDQLWRTVETPAEIAALLNDVMPDLVATFGLQASALSAEWYDALRDQVAVPKAFQAIPAEIPDPGVFALIGWAEETAGSVAAFRTLIEGGAQRRISNFSRLTVMRSSLADPSAAGWRRTGLGRCDFCRMLIGRGAVYRENTVAFRSHDHCACGAEPDFG